MKNQTAATAANRYFLDFTPSEPAWHGS